MEARATPTTMDGEASAVEPSLVAAYAATVYRARARPDFDMRVGEPSPEAKELMAACGCSSALFIAAANPFGELEASSRNARQSDALRGEIDRSFPGAVVHEAIGFDPSGDWEGERSFLVVGASRAESARIGRLFEQNAVVWVGADAVPRLLLLR